MEEVTAKTFRAQTGSLKGMQASLKIPTDVTPKFLKPIVQYPIL